VKAIVSDKYGLDNLKLAEVDKPVPKDNEVLVKVKAASVNFNTVFIVTGQPFFAHFFMGFFKPKYRIPGNDIAGVVEAVGKDVKQFKPGDAVYADTWRIHFGAFAEYICAPESVLARKPANLSFKEAAASPEAGLVALHGLRDDGHVAKGKQVLVYSASGGIGTFAVQIAKASGAEVTAVCGQRNVELLKSLGADASLITPKRI